MFANERRNALLEMLERNQTVTVSELKEKFQVSIETIRRDLEYLEERHALTRVHGGAISNRGMARFTKLCERVSEHTQNKRLLSLTACQYIEEGDFIAVDSGSTAIEFAKVLAENFHSLSVVTNSPEVFDLLSAKEGFELIATGGQYLQEERAFYGHIALDALKKLHVSKSFIFPFAISLSLGVSVFHHNLYEIQRAYLDIADQPMVLADSSKFEKTAAIRLCSLQTPCRIVTDPALPDEVWQMYLNQSVKLVRS